jgi:hypothetical protein
MMTKYLLAIKRFILKQRIHMLRSDILLCSERLDENYEAQRSLEAWLAHAHHKERMLKIRLMLAERPEVLLKEIA